MIVILFSMVTIIDTTNVTMIDKIRAARNGLAGTCPIGKMTDI